MNVDIERKWKWEKKNQQNDIQYLKIVKVKPSEQWCLFCEFVFRIRFLWIMMILLLLFEMKKKSKWSISFNDNLLFYCIHKVQMDIENIIIKQIQPLTHQSIHKIRKEEAHVMISLWYCSVWYLSFSRVLRSFIGNIRKTNVSINLKCVNKMCIFLHKIRNCR